jgi:hypothetical protein
MNVDLVLPDHLVLSQSVVLPEAALANLREAINYGFPSWSPFAADELYLKESIERIQTGRVTVGLHYIRKAKADPFLEKLFLEGLAPDRLVMGPNPDCFIELPSQKVDRLRRARRIDLALYVGALVLTMILFIMRNSDLSSRIAQVDEALRSEVLQFRQEEALRSGFDQLRERRMAVARRRASELSASELLGALANQLSEDVALRSVEIERNRGRLEVIGGDAKKLLDDLRPIGFVQQLKVDATQPAGIVAITFQIARKKP